MRETSDTNELLPLTDAANHSMQDYTKKIKEFAASSSWGATAVALHMVEGSNGYDVTLGFELQTPLDFPLQDVVTAHGATKEQATLRAVAEWLQLFFKPALRIHFDLNDDHMRDGETTAGRHTIYWRMAVGSVMVQSEHLTDMGQLKAELAERPLFDRVELGDVLKFQHDVPVMCVKMQLWRPAGEKMETVYDCKLNNEEWEEGLERLKRFELQAGNTSMMVRQYLFLKRVEKEEEVVAGAGGAVSAKGATKVPMAKGATRVPSAKGATRMPSSKGATKMGVVANGNGAKVNGPAKGAVPVAAVGGAGGRKAWWKFW